ncbi:ABC transporter substrate-binding protein [Stutzerimonas kirkiae]|nr:ABC transporter substrate-binding protein [Stutzerimonas kirkiae]
MSRLLLSLLLMVALLPAHAGQTRTLTDVAGRQVQVPLEVDRIVLGEGRYLATLAIFDRDDPVRRVVGMFGELERLDPATYAQYLERFPQIGKVPRVGRSSEDSFSIEQTIALRPQVALFGLEGHGPTPHSQEVLDRLQAAGITVVFVDFRKNPLENTTRSIQVLGELLGQTEVADEFVAFYQEEMAKVRTAVARSQTRPVVFLESRVGLNDECCESIAHGLFADYVDAAGGRNLAQDKIPGTSGMLSMEYLLQAQPEVYIATAIGSVGHLGDQPGRVVLGVGADEEVARRSLRHALGRPGFAGLAAVEQGRAHAIWHHFYNSPFNVAAVQAIAAWLHPQEMQGIDPQRTLAELYRRFQPVPLHGAYWVDLND